MKLISVIGATALMFGSLLASDTVDDNVLKFEKERFSKNKRVEINSVKINTKREMPQKGWYGYIIDLDAKMAGKEIKAKDVVFSNGEIIAPELFDIKTGMALKDLMNPKLTKDYYDEKKLIAGNPKAKDKLVVFSDPLCPFCMDYLPDVISYVKEHKDSIALYYYHFPLLRIHPASAPLSALMLVAKNDGMTDIELKVYEADWDKYFDSKETNAQKVIDGFNKEFNTSYTINDIKNEKVGDELSADISKGDNVMVQGTPTIFVNGEQDKSKLKYEMLGN